MYPFFKEMLGSSLFLKKTLFKSELVCISSKLPGVGCSVRSCWGCFVETGMLVVPCRALVSLMHRGREAVHPFPPQHVGIWSFDDRHTLRLAFACCLCVVPKGDLFFSNASTVREVGRQGGSVCSARGQGQTPTPPAGIVPFRCGRGNRGGMFVSQLFVKITYQVKFN